jgi:hypothetical protein
MSRWIRCGKNWTLYFLLLFLRREIVLTVLWGVALGFGEFYFCFVTWNARERGSIWGCLYDVIEAQFGAD